MTSRRNCIAGRASGVSSRSSDVVLAEDRGLELAELRAGIDAELLDEGLARGAVGGERVRLAARAVEREHELRARALAQRLGLDERLELGDELGVTAEREVGVDALLDDDGSQLLEARDLRLRERLVDEVGERRPAPERERLAQRDLGGGCVARLERGPPLLRQAREAVHVHALGIELEDVAGRARGDDGAEHLAELRDVDLDGVRGRLRRIARPERLDEPVDGDDASRLEREDGEERARLLAAQR